MISDTVWCFSGAHSALKGVERALYDGVAAISFFVVYSLSRDENRAPAPHSLGPEAAIAAGRFNDRGGGRSKERVL